jgi:hypothetical protein
MAGAMPAAKNSRGGSLKDATRFSRVAAPRIAHGEAGMGTFAHKTHAQVENDVIVFSLALGGETRQFEISGDALRECFGAEDSSGSALLRAFERGSEKIRTVAEAAFNTPTDGVTTLGTGDFDG